MSNSTKHFRLPARSTSKPFSERILTITASELRLHRAMNSLTRSNVIQRCGRDGEWLGFGVDWVPGKTIEAMARTEWTEWVTRLKAYKTIQRYWTDRWCDKVKNLVIFPLKLCSFIQSVLSLGSFQDHNPTILLRRHCRQLCLRVWTTTKSRISQSRMSNDNCPPISIQPREIGELGGTIRERTDRRCACDVLVKQFYRPFEWKMICDLTDWRHSDRIVIWFPVFHQFGILRAFCPQLDFTFADWTFQDSKRKSGHDRLSIRDSPIYDHMLS
jgi:hypothetical protein